MRNIIKRMTALLCVIVLLSAMMAVPAMAARDDWTVQFTSKSYYTDWATRWGTWRKVTFKFKGTGIQAITPVPHYSHYWSPVQCRNLQVQKWNPAGQWCYGSIEVRGVNNGHGYVDLYFTGSSCRGLAINVQ